MGQRSLPTQDPYPNCVAPTAVAGAVAGVAAAVTPGVTAFHPFNRIEAAAACQQLGLSPFGAQWVPLLEALSEEERGLNSNSNLHSNSELNPASTSRQQGSRRLRSGAVQGQGRRARGARRALLLSTDRLKISLLAPFDKAHTMQHHRSAGGYQSGDVMDSITAIFDITATCHQCCCPCCLPLLRPTPQSKRAPMAYQWLSVKPLSSH